MAGLVGGCTPDIDRQYLVMARLGQRFLLYRPPTRTEEIEKASVNRAVQNRKQVETMRSELRTAALGVLAGCSNESRDLTDSEVEWLIDISWLVAQGRTGVATAYNGEIVDKIEPELPTRLAMSLAGLQAGMDAIGVQHDAALLAVRNTALGCVPASRREALELLLKKGDELTTRDVALGLHQEGVSSSV